MEAHYAERWRLEGGKALRMQIMQCLAMGGRGGVLQRRGAHPLAHFPRPLKRLGNGLFSRLVVLITASGLRLVRRPGLERNHFPDRKVRKEGEQGSIAKRWLRRTKKTR